MREERDIKQIGPYKLLSLIAEGGMAGVYLAEKEEAAGLKRTVAIKRIRPELASDPHFTERFIAEARISLDLQHPNLIRVYGFEKIDSELLLVMEYIDGCDLSALQNRTIPAAAFRSLAAQAADALAALHAIGVTHRDISPSNILIDRKGLVKLSDLGIAAALHSEDYTPQDFGKRRYLSPSVIAGNPSGPQDDMYSLALVLVECAAGSSIDNADGQADLKMHTARMRKFGMEREAELLMQAAGLADEKIEAFEFAAAMRASGTEDRQTLAELVNSCCNRKDTTELTMPLPVQAEENKEQKILTRTGTVKKIIRLAMLLAAVGFIIAQIIIAVMLRDNNESSGIKSPLPANPEPQQIDLDYAQLPLDAKPRALIKIDGEEKGSTPLRLKLKPGLHEIEFIWRDENDQETITSRRALIQSGPNREIFVSRKIPKQ